MSEFDKPYWQKIFLNPDIKREKFTLTYYGTREEVMMIDMWTGEKEWLGDWSEEDDDTLTRFLSSLPWQLTWNNTPEKETILEHSFACLWSREGSMKWRVFRKGEEKEFWIDIGIYGNSVYVETSRDYYTLPKEYGFEECYKIIKKEIPKENYALLIDHAWT